MLEQINTLAIVLLLVAVVGLEVSRSKWKASAEHWKRATEFQDRIITATAEALVERDLRILVLEEKAVEALGARADRWNASRN
jgi:vacuolar-type H+-ATPase subunit F/Vma7